MRKWVYSGMALVLVAALLLAAFPDSAIAQQSRTRIAYLLAETAYVSGDVTVGDDLTVTDDVTVTGDVTAAGFTTSGGGGIASVGVLAADSVSVADGITATDLDLGGHITSFGAPITVITSTQTITPSVEGVYVIASGGAAAELSIQKPSASGHDGLRITVISLEATAHKVIAPTIGFNEGDAAADTCTFSTAIGNSIEVILYEGEWYILNHTNCTLG